MDDARTAGPRAMGRWPEVALGLATAAFAANLAMLVVAWPRGDEPWAAGVLVVLAISVVIRRRRPDLAVSAWSSFMVLASSTGELTNSALSATLDGDPTAVAVASVAAIGLCAGAFGGASTVQFLAVYPDDQPIVGWQRPALRTVWIVTFVPLIVIVAAADVPIPPYIDGPDVDNPFNIVPFEMAPGTVDAIVGLSAILLLPGVAILVSHYRRAVSDTRRRIRWLLVPFPLVLFGMALNALLADSAKTVVWLTFLVLLPAIPVASAIGILQPPGWDADWVLRRSLVYGVLWLAIVGAFVGTAAIAGTTAGRYVPVGWAVAVALVVSLLFQPLRRRLETLAERWVFGEPVDHSGVITRLGATLADTFDIESLVPRMVAALEEGLQLTWARVRLTGMDDEPTADGSTTPEPLVVVPIELDGERLGVVECGARRDGSWTDDDRAVVASFARQAALAVRNVRLTEQTARYAADLEISRARIARAAESERRRIERNIHDGIQQDLVVLIGMAGRIQEEDTPAAVTVGLAELRTRLERVLSDLRDLARGIYPSVLSDQGVLPAVEALVASHPHPIRLRADAVLRGLRLPDEIEGAAYFTVAEALTNSLKHADASLVDVKLSRVDGTLVIEVADDGAGFDAGAACSGRGLQGLADRLGALGGTLGVDSEPGRGTVVLATLSATAGTGT